MSYPKHSTKQQENKPDAAADVQLCLPQIRSSWLSPKQWSPNNAGRGLVHVRSRRSRPPSHVTGHPPQADQLDHPPCTGIIGVYPKKRLSASNTIFGDCLPFAQRAPRQSPTFLNAVETLWGRRSDVTGDLVMVFHQLLRKLWCFN